MTIPPQRGFAAYSRKGRALQANGNADECHSWGTEKGGSGDPQLPPVARSLKEICTNDRYVDSAFQKMAHLGHHPPFGGGAW